jgi:hypothetical protein
MDATWWIIGLYLLVILLTVLRVLAERRYRRHIDETIRDAQTFRKQVGMDPDRAHEFSHEEMQDIIEHRDKIARRRRENLEDIKRNTRSRWT